jgi:hypothetical protein
VTLRTIQTSIFAIIIAFILTLLLDGCRDRDDRLFYISDNTGESSDFVSLAESTNVPTLSRDSLAFYLHPHEREDSALAAVSYKNFGKIASTPNFKVFILLRKSGTPGRDYAFLLRTYRHDWKIIDTYVLGVWKENTKRFCFGSVSPGLIIQRKCADDRSSDHLQITKRGIIAGK